MLIAWPGDQHAVIVAIWRHDRSSGDVYDVLLEHLGLEALTAEREKPPCCDEYGLPPVDPKVATAIVDALDRGRRTR